jgi:endonuclease YncB( thermonuclease family)
MSNRNRIKRLINPQIVATLFWGIFMLSLFACALMPAPVPTLDSDAVATYAFQTALVLEAQTDAASSPTPEPTFTPLPTVTDTPVPATDTPLPQPTNGGGLIPLTDDSCIPNNPPQTGRVLDIVDGDTIVVVLDQDGEAYSVRYIGMDTPENTTRTELFGPEATAKNRELVEGKNVTLIKDVSEIDRYGRLLRYVIADGVFVNYELVAQGYANVASFPPDLACIPDFQEAEEQAVYWKLGLWGDPPPPTPTEASSSGAAPVCACSGNLYNCSDFSTRAGAQACFNYCVSSGHGDVHRLADDNDSTACESLP